MHITCPAKLKRVNHSREDDPSRKLHALRIVHLPISRSNLPSRYSVKLARRKFPKASLRTWRMAKLRVHLFTGQTTFPLALAAPEKNGHARAWELARFISSFGKRERCQHTSLRCRQLRLSVAKTLFSHATHASRRTAGVLINYVIRTEAFREKCSLQLFCFCANC